MGTFTLLTLTLLFSTSFCSPVNQNSSDNVTDDINIQHGWDLNNDDFEESYKRGQTMAIVFAVIGITAVIGVPLGIFCCIRCCCYEWFKEQRTIRFQGNMMMVHPPPQPMNQPGMNQNAPPPYDTQPQWGGPPQQQFQQPPPQGYSTGFELSTTNYAPQKN